MGASALLEALRMPEDVWEAAEREREEQMTARKIEQEFLDKWLPVWRHFGRVMDGCEQYAHLL